jgi:hypothetical protein
MISAMPADVAEAVRSVPCGGCQAARAEPCSCAGTHLARWELAAASGLVSPQEYQAAAGAAWPAPPGSPPGLAVVPELSGVVCTAACHPLRWAAGEPLPQWVHLDPATGPSCAAPALPRPAPGEPCRFHRRHWLMGVPAVAVAGPAPACQRCARKHARRARRRWNRGPAVSAGPGPVRP